MTISPENNFSPVYARTYRRISDKFKQADGVSLDQQIERIERYAREQGMVIVGRYEDRVTGTRADRPDYLRMLADLRRGEVVLIWMVDRIGRNKAESFRMYEEIERKGVRLVSVHQPEMSEELRDILTIAAAWESKRTAERVKASMAYAAGIGLCVAKPPLWYAIGPDRRLVPTEGHERAQGIWEQFLARPSLQAVALANGFIPASLRNMFNNPAYRGDTEWSTLYVPNTHPAIVRPDTWEAVHQIVRRRSDARRREREGTPLLTGLLYLADTSQRLYYWRAHNPANNLYSTRRDGVTPLRSCRADAAEAYAIERLCALTLTERHAAALRDRWRAGGGADAHAAEQSRIASALTRIAAAKVRVARTHAEGRLDDPTFDTLYADLVREEAAHTAARAALGAPDPAAAERAIALRLNLADAVNALWHAGEVHLLRPMIETFIERIDADIPPNSGVMGRNASRYKPPATFRVHFNPAVVIP